MTIKRQITAELEILAKGYPVVTITGPRQSGKTTLVQGFFPDKAYVTLEDPDIRRVAIEDPRRFLEQFPDGAILDEVQRAPDLLSYIQGIVDRKKRPAFFVLTGSAQLLLLEAVTQSLAGRTALLTLLPLSMEELAADDPKWLAKPLDEIMWRGFYPAIFDRDLDPNAAYRNYFQTFVERDVRLVSNIGNLTDFERFVRILAGRTGQLLNIHSISAEVGVSQPTIKSWLSILEAIHIVHRLTPFYENFGKRLVKTPKIYFNDTGLLCFLLGIETPQQLGRDPLRGQIFENLCVVELIKARLNRGKSPNLYFFRDNHGLEVDLLFAAGSTLQPVEVKSAHTFQPSMVDGIKRFLNIISGKTAEKPSVIYGGDQDFEFKDVRVIPATNCYRLFV